MSAVYTEKIATDLAYPHLIVYQTFRDSTQNGWRLTTESGYVMYDTNDHYTQLYPDTTEETPVTYYYTGAHLPVNYNFDAFPWVAVPRKGIDENCIFDAEKDT